MRRPEPVAVGSRPSEGVPELVRVAWPPLLMIGLFSAFDAWLSQAIQLPESAVYERVLAWAFARELGLWWLLPAMLLVLLRWRRATLPRWEELDAFPGLRTFVLLAMGLLVWDFAFYDYNLYFERWHLVDRALLVACFAAAFSRPVAVLPFLFVLFPVLYQFQYPGGLPYLFPEKLLPAHVLTLFASYLILVAFDRERRWPLLFGLLTLVAASYWPSGWAKLRMHWLETNAIADVVFAAHANGWLAGVPSEWIVQISRAVALVDLPLRIFTLVLELGVLAMLFRRGVAIGLLGGLVVLHLGIFAVGGILFLNWIVVDAALVVVLWRLDSERSIRIFRPALFALAVPLTLGGSLWLTTTAFAWFDTRLTYAYRLTAVGESGERYRLSPETFEPYRYPITWNRFGYLYPGRQLPVRYGATGDPEVVLALRQARSLDAIERLERSHGIVRFDPEASARFVDFVRGLVDGLNRHPKLRALRWLERPSELVSSPWPGSFDGEEKICRVEVSRVTTLYDGTSYREIRREALFPIEIDRCGGSSGSATESATTPEAPTGRD